jgi:hypothetical protein
MCDNFALVRGCSGTSNAEGNNKKLPEKSRLALESTKNLELAKNSPQYFGRSGRDGKALYTPADRGDGWEEERREGMRKGVWCSGYTNETICLCKWVSQMCNGNTICILFVSIQTPFV